MPTFYYSKPTQVKYYNWINEEWSFGIAFDGHVIDGNNGLTYATDHILNKGAEKNIAVPIIDLPWTNLNKTIEGCYL